MESVEVTGDLVKGFYVSIRSTSPFSSFKIFCSSQDNQVIGRIEIQNMNLMMESCSKHLEIPIGVKYANKTVMWFLFDSSNFVVACGYGNKPSTSSTIGLIADVNVPEISKVSFTSSNITFVLSSAISIHLSMKKWNTDRSLRTFKGNTIVCNVKKPSLEQNTFITAQNKLKELPIGYSQVFLPTNSFHVTVLSLVNEGNFEDIMKKKLQSNMNWEPIHKRYKKKLNRAISRYQNYTIKFKVVHFELQRHFGAIVEPADSKTKQLMDKMYSDFIIAAGFTGNIKRYPYHVSLGYGFLPLMPHLKDNVDSFITELEKELLPLEFELEAPFFAKFDDMGEFIPY